MLRRMFRVLLLLVLLINIVAALHAENVLARKYFWPGCHGMKPYQELFPHAGLMLRNTERVANRVIVLPSGTSQ